MFYSNSIYLSICQGWYCRFLTFSKAILCVFPSRSSQSFKAVKSSLHNTSHNELSIWVPNGLVHSDDFSQDATTAWSKNLLIHKQTAQDNELFLYLSFSLCPSLSHGTWITNWNVYSMHARAVKFAFSPQLPKLAFQQPFLRAKMSAFNFECRSFWKIEGWSSSHFRKVSMLSRKIILHKDQGRQGSWAEVKSPQ